MESKPRFLLSETVYVHFSEGIRVGRIMATEPGENLCPPIKGTAYYVRIPSHDALSSRVVIVGESKLGKLTEED